MLIITSRDSLGTTRRVLYEVVVMLIHSAQKEEGGTCSRGVAGNGTGFRQVSGVRSMFKPLSRRCLRRMLEFAAMTGRLLVPTHSPFTGHPARSRELDKLSTPLISTPSSLGSNQPITGKSNWLGCGDLHLGCQRCKRCCEMAGLLLCDGSTLCQHTRLVLRETRPWDGRDYDPLIAGAGTCTGRSEDTRAWETVRGKRRNLLIRRQCPPSHEARASKQHSLLFNRWSSHSSSHQRPIVKGHSPSGWQISILPSLLHRHPLH